MKAVRTILCTLGRCAALLLVVTLGAFLGTTMSSPGDDRGALARFEAKAPRADMPCLRLSEFMPTGGLREVQGQARAALLEARGLADGVGVFAAAEPAGGRVGLYFVGALGGCLLGAEEATADDIAQRFGVLAEARRALSGTADR